MASEGSQGLWKSKTGAQHHIHVYVRDGRTEKSFSGFSHHASDLKVVVMET